MPRIFELPEDLAEYLDDTAQKTGKRDAQEVLVRLVYEHLQSYLKRSTITNMLPGKQMPPPR